MELREAREDYLETVYQLTLENKVKIKNVRIAERLGVAKPSVTVMLRRLVEDGYLERSMEGIFSLTPDGERIAKKLYERRHYFSALLLKAGVDPEMANREAGRMEHVLCDDSYEKLKVCLSAVM